MIHPFGLDKAINGSTAECSAIIEMSLKYLSDHLVVNVHEFLRLRVRVGLPVLFDVLLVRFGSLKTQRPLRRCTAKNIRKINLPRTKRQQLGVDERAQTCGGRW